MEEKKHKETNFFYGATFILLLGCIFMYEFIAKVDVKPNNNYNSQIKIIYKLDK